MAILNFSMSRPTRRAILLLPRRARFFPFGGQGDLLDGLGALSVALKSASRLVLAVIRLQRGFTASDATLIWKIRTLLISARFLSSKSEDRQWFPSPGAIRRILWLERSAPIHPSPSFSRATLGRSGLGWMHPPVAHDHHLLEPKALAHLLYLAAPASSDRRCSPAKTSPPRPDDPSPPVTEQSVLNLEFALFCHRD